MKSIDEFIHTVSKLRAKDGCLWDKKQTHKSLKRYLIEEAYEAIEAINSKNTKALMEELGDILLQVVLHSQIASENKEFTFNDIANHINKKMISRHPHVFGKIKVKSVDEVLKNWEQLKRLEKPSRKEIFDGVPNSLPALLKALKVSKKASRAGFEWENESNLWSTLEKELKEFKEIRNSKNKERQKEELGDLLYMIVNLARWYKLDPEDALDSAIKKFINRMNKVKQLSKQDLKELSTHELEKLWKKVKKEGRIKQGEKIC